MVSNASDDLPEPDRPVTTTSRSRGRSTSMFFRLWTRAPRTAIQSVMGCFCRNRWPAPNHPFYLPAGRPERPGWANFADELGDLLPIDALLGAARAGALDGERIALERPDLPPLDGLAAHLPLARDRQPAAVPLGGRYDVDLPAA